MSWACSSSSRSVGRPTSAPAPRHRRDEQALLSFWAQVGEGMGLDGTRRSMTQWQQFCRQHEQRHSQWTPEGQALARTCLEDVVRLSVPWWGRSAFRALMRATAEPAMWRLLGLTPSPALDPPRMALAGPHGLTVGRRHEGHGARPHIGTRQAQAISPTALRDNGDPVHAHAMPRLTTLPRTGLTTHTPAQPSGGQAPWRAQACRAFPQLRVAPSPIDGQGVSPKRPSRPARKWERSGARPSRCRKRACGHAAGPVSTSSN